MNTPNVLDNASVLCIATIDDRVRPTLATRHLKFDILQPPAAHLAICCYDDTDLGYYLFGCDAEWNVVTDTWHESIDAAKRQARFEYEGIDDCWRTINAY